ncbi:hypothetical protein KY361_04795 [Candidatus Woesearchaeota archaeon]|nr:hypothetical protein [Candidatus Woesearchaeota archaeon]
MKMKKSILKKMHEMPMPMKKMHPHRKKIVFEGVMVSLPLAATFVWYSFLILSSTPVAGAGARFAPSKIETLVLFILLFIVAYSIFLVFEIRHLKRRWDKAGKK